MAEVLLCRALPDAEVTSAGTRFRGGVVASAGSVRVMAARGLGLDDHVSRRLAGEMLDGVDLVVGMAREHVREAVVTEPAAFPRTFTLKELVRRGEAVGSRREGQPVGEWLAEVHGDRRATDLLGDDPADDVIDPMGGPESGYEAVAAEIEALVARLTRLLRL
jgi:protein-tyrosine phosphatase